MFIASITGRLVADMTPKTIPAQDGSQRSILEGRIAVDRIYSRQTDNNKTMFINVSLNGTRYVQNADKYKKGRLVFVTGQFDIRPYTDKNGVQKTSYDVLANSIEFLSRDPSAPVQSGAPAQQPAQQARQQQPTPAPQVQQAPVAQPQQYAPAPQVQQVPVAQPQQYAPAPQVQQAPVAQPQQLVRRQRTIYAPAPQVQQAPAPQPQQYAPASQPQQEAIPTQGFETTPYDGYDLDNA